MSHPPDCMKCRILGVMCVLIRQHVYVRKLPPLLQVAAIAAGVCTREVKYETLIEAARGLTKEGHRIKVKR